MMKRYAALLLPCIVLAGCTLDSLWGLDSPRPALQRFDIFTVDPVCRDLVIDTEALTTVPVIITMTGKRRDSGLGAEGVPVSVTRGPCNGTVAALDASVLDPKPDAGTGVEGGPPAMTCTRDASRLAADLSDRIMLAERPGEGCQFRSPARLDCTLDPRGEAAFQVTSNLTEQEVTDLAGGALFVPLCLRPLEFGRADKDGKSERTDVRHHSTEVWVLPRAGRVSAALATIVQNVDAASVVSSDETRLCSGIFDCSVPRQRAALRAGFVSREVSESLVSVENLVPVNRTVDVRAVLSVVRQPSAGAAYLSATGCGGASGASTLDLQIAESERSTLPFFVCGPGHAAEYSVVTRIATASAGPPAREDGGVDGGIVDEGVVDGGAPPAQPSEPADAMSTSDIVVYAASVAAASQHRGFVVTESGDDGVVETLSCDGATDPLLTPGLILVRDPLVESGDTVLATCGDEEDSGTPGCDARTISIELTDGNTCDLEVPAL